MDFFIDYFVNNFDIIAEVVKVIIRIFVLENFTNRINFDFIVNWKHSNY